MLFPPTAIYKSYAIFKIPIILFFAYFYTFKIPEEPLKILSL